jgi:hypothetical protein
MGQGNAFTPQVIKDQRAGVRRSVAPLLALIDTEDPAFSHIAEALESMKDAGVELDEAAVVIAVKLGRQKHANTQPGAWKPRHATPARRSIVYYIRRGDLIKIGTTTNPVSRFKDLMPDEILAFEPGGPDDEARRHRQFAWCRITKRGEYFRQTTRLLGHIEALRKEHGDPDPAWPTVKTLGKGTVRTRVKIELPEPATDEVATATEGAKLLGLSKSTVAAWAHRKVITPVGVNDLGRPVYYVDHMRFLIERSRRWLNRKPCEIREAS